MVRLAQTRIVVVGPVEGHLPPGLDSVPTLEQGLSAVAGYDVLAVVSSRALPGEDSRELFSFIKRSAPSTLAICLDSGVVGRDPVALPDIVATTWSLDEIPLRVARLLDTARYTDLFIEAYAEALEESLMHLGSHHAPDRFMLRTTDALPVGRHAMIPWGGTDSSGWLTLSTDNQTVRALMGLVPCTGERERQNADAACELANQVLGALKRSLDRRGASIELGLPLSFEGARPPFTHGRAPSTLMARATSPQHCPVWVDVAVSSAPELQPAVAVEDEMGLGELSFL